MLDKQFGQVCCAVKNIVHLLDFAQTYETAGTHGLFWVPICKAVKEARELSTNQKNLTIDISGIDFEVLADDALIEIFHNFIDNSLKYGRNLSLIKIFTEQNRTGHLGIVYEDNGGGIDPEIRRRLFQKAAGRGTGLGLYLIQRICKVYSWQVQEEGVYGAGVRFVLSMGPDQYRPIDAALDYDSL
jgi:signal transduction histidine kinase